jgi:predicted nuclease of restriction endonuclease-like RecB superfamily
VNRQDPSDRWLIEIMGFWTADYVAKKLRRLRSAGLGRLILCVDATRNCGSDELPHGAHVLKFKKRVDVRDVLNIIEGEGHG